MRSLRANALSAAASPIRVADSLGRGRTQVGEAVRARVERIAAGLETISVSSPAALRWQRESIMAFRAAAAANEPKMFEDPPRTDDEEAAPDETHRAL